MLEVEVETSSVVVLLVFLGLKVALAPAWV
jgi:hypothetical protein